MSAHYDFCKAFDLRPETPAEVIDILHYMSHPSEQPRAIPNHIFFHNDSWRTMLSDVNDQRYPGVAGTIIRKAYRHTQAGTDVYRTTFCFRCTVLDDSFYETWWLFCECIAPHVETAGWVGYYREEFKLHPTLMYFRGGKVYICEVTQSPLDIRDGQPW